MKTQLRVLVVEDSRSWQVIYRRDLRALGHEVVLAADKDDAYRQLEREKFDAFLIDVALNTQDDGNKDGLELLGWLARRHFAYRVIMNSAHFSSDTREQIDRLEPCAVIEKGDKNRLLLLKASLDKVQAGKAGEN